MAEMIARSFDSPDEVRPFADKGQIALVHVPGGAVGKGTFEPGWRWSEHVKPIAHTDSCQVHHLGYVLQGRMRMAADGGGDEVEVGPGEVFDIAPGHDAWIVGDETCVLIDFAGASVYAKPA